MGYLDLIKSKRQEAEKKANLSKQAGTEEISDVKGINIVKDEVTSKPTSNPQGKEDFSDKIDWAASNKEFSNPQKRTENFPLPSFLNMQHDEGAHDYSQALKKGFDKKADFLKSYYRLDPSLDAKKVYDKILSFPQSQHYRFWGPYSIKEEQFRDIYDLDKVNNHLEEEYKKFQEDPLAYEEKQKNEYGSLLVGENDEDKSATNASSAPRKTKEQRMAEQKAREEALEAKNNELRKNAINTVLEANKNMSDVANTDILRANGINADSMSSDITSEGVEVYFDMDGLNELQIPEEITQKLNKKIPLSDEEEALRKEKMNKINLYYNKLGKLVEDLGIDATVGVSPITGKGKFKFKNKSVEEELPNDDEEIFYDDVDGYSEGISTEDIEKMKEQKEREKWGE